MSGKTFLRDVTFIHQHRGGIVTVSKENLQQELDRLQTYLNPDEGYLWQHKHNQLRATLHIAESVALRMSSG
jgi:hypothetical protein